MRSEIAWKELSTASGGKAVGKLALPPLWWKYKMIGQL
jgi:hypothetical protein